MQVTSVTATGEAEAPYNLVGFNVSLSELASSVPLAKSKLKGKIAALYGASRGWSSHRTSNRFQTRRPSIDAAEW